MKNFDDPVAEPDANPKAKRYASWMAYHKDQPPAPPEPKTRAPIPVSEYFVQMNEARRRYAEAQKHNEEVSRQNNLMQNEVDELESQKRSLKKQKISTLESADKKRLTELCQDIEIVEHQIYKKNTELDALKQEDTNDLLKEVIEAERRFYAQLLDSYKKEVTAGKCDLPFSLLLKRAFALGTRCGVGDIVNYLFQWVSVPSLCGEDIEETLKQIEQEFKKAK